MAQQEIKDVIKNIPKELISYIQDEQKSKLYNTINLNDTVKIKNALNGTTSIYIIGKKFAKIVLNEIVDLQIKLLPYNDSTEIICLVKTIHKPVKESTIQFFSTEWNNINEKFGLPQTDNKDLSIEPFILCPDNISKEKFIELISYIDPIIINADISEADNTITYNLSIPFIQKERSEEIKSIIRQNTFKWTGCMFKKC